MNRREKKSRVKTRRIENRREKKSRVKTRRIENRREKRIEGKKKAEQRIGVTFLERRNVW